MGKKLLVADDSVTIQKVIKLALSSEGYDILAVSEGKEAIRAILEEKPDVVLIDVALPGADAYAVKRAVNQGGNSSSARFVLMASAFERIDEKAAEETGFHGRLIKPFDPSHLRRTVSELMTLDIEEQSNADFISDLPPVVDMHPTIEATSQEEILTEDEFKEVGAPPPPPLATEEEQALENDIKDLTESTIKMSGLDEFQWNLDDSKKMKASTPQRSAEVASLDRTREISRPVNRPTITAPTRPIDDGGSNFLTLGVSHSETKKAEARTHQPAATSRSHSNEPTRADIEQFIRKDAEALIEKVVRELVPQIAEQLIRKEIEKILAEE